MLRNTVIVDGSNIATEGRSTPSLRQLDEAVRAFIEDHPTDNLVVIVDATFGHRIDESERPEFEEAILAGELITPPAGTIGRGDAFIIQIADKADATVLSNDSFQELHAQYPWLFDEGRLIGGKPVPGLGWVFILRTPVRGPVSRRVTREAKSGSQHDKNGSQSRDSHGRKAKKTDKTKGPQRDVTAQKQTPVRAGSGGADKKLPDTPINDAVPFFDFVGAHPVGSRVTGKITEFSSHGAYADVEGVRCYVPLRLMGDPAPRSAKEVVKMGEERQFVLFALDPPRRGVDLALVAAPQATPSATSEAPGSEKSSASTTAPPKARAKATARSGAETSDIDAPADASDVVNEPAAKKAATKKAAATKSAATKKSAAKKVATTKAPTKKVAAKKSATTKAATKKVAGTKVASKTVATEKPTPATKASATTKVATKKAPAKKPVAKKPATRRAATTKATSKKAVTKTAATAKTAPATKSAAKKPATKKAAATKATPTKAVAKKAAGKAAPAKKAATKTATAKKATAKKAPAKSTPAKKSPAKKSPAKKTTTKKTNKNENVAG